MEGTSTSYHLPSVGWFYLSRSTSRMKRFQLLACANIRHALNALGVPCRCLYSNAASSSASHCSGPTNTLRPFVPRPTACSVSFIAFPPLRRLLKDSINDFLPVMRLHHSVMNLFVHHVNQAGHVQIGVNCLQHAQQS